MTFVRRSTAAILVFALVLALATSVGCKKKADEPVLEPKIAPPVISTAGTLKVGVDLSYPPFAGTDEGVNAGIDVDVAAAIAERLGLRIEIVDIKPNEMAAALNEGTVDIMLGGVSITDAVTADVSTAGTYLVDGPGIFAIVPEGSAVATLTADALPGKRVGTQNSSPSFWTLESDYGEGFATPYATLKEAFDALVAGQVDLVVGDAAVGSYIARDYPAVRFSGQFGAAQPLVIAVKKDATDLETAVREQLDALAADGTLDTIRNKWLGDLPVLEVPAEETTG
ncbi:MAG: amino acid ABC transporter substrate-binding protein [Actinobacteria bacterium]|nr:amino acid ABC transporter substrate-binding protein [Actinomycetota bacterium]